jgi:hypothetical protein
MKQFSEKLNAVIIEAIAELQNLIYEKGIESKHSNTKVLKIKDDDFMFNLEGGRYLTEISEGALIDNQGYVYGHDVLPTIDLISLIDHLIKHSKTFIECKDCGADREVLRSSAYNHIQKCTNCNAKLYSEYISTCGSKKNS